jgi:hypothetical protein
MGNYNKLGIILLSSYYWLRTGVLQTYKNEWNDFNDCKRAFIKLASNFSSIWIWKIHSKTFRWLKDGQGTWKIINVQRLKSSVKFEIISYFYVKFGSPFMTNVWIIQKKSKHSEYAQKIARIKNSIMIKIIFCWGFGGRAAFPFGTRGHLRNSARMHVGVRITLT